MAYAEVTYDYNTHSVYPTKMLHQFLQNVNVFVMYAMYINPSNIIILSNLFLRFITNLFH